LKIQALIEEKKPQNPNTISILYINSHRSSNIDSNISNNIKQKQVCHKKLIYGLKEKKSLENQIREIKTCLRFYDKLFSASSIENFLLLLYKETSRQFKIRSLVFCWRSGHFGPVQYVCDARGTYKKFHHYYPRSDQHPQQSIKVKNTEDGQYLADLLGRPVQNVLNIPVWTRQYGVNKPVYIFVEFFAGNSDKLLCFYKSALSLITERLDRLLLKDHLETGIELWTATFDSLKEPLVILDENDQPGNTNALFDIVFEKNTAHLLNQQTVQWKNRIFEKHSYPVCTEDGAYTVCHYVDISESLNLRKRMIQNIKMSALGELGETVAHQLSNPLTGVLSMAQLLLDSDKLDGKTRTDIKDIVKAVSRSQEIIANLLDFSRANSQLDLCDLNVMVKKTIPFLKSMICFSDFQLTACETPVPVSVQACLIQQVIFNLVKNACQAVSDLTDSARKITVRIDKEKDQAVLYVEDNGQGIGPADYDNVFKLFFTTKSKTGTGLGLNISRSIVESFGGTLMAGRSTLGGACFTMLLPLKCGGSKDL